MAVRQIKNKKEWTKDGRSWVYEARFNGKTYKSKKFFTKKEAQAAEREFLYNANDNLNLNKRMTMDELFSDHFESQKGEVKQTTITNYINKRKHFDSIKNIRVSELCLRDIMDWRKEINKKDLATRTKNDLLKYLKSVLNYGRKMYKFNFMDFYDNIPNFKNLNEVQKEMAFYTYDEFQQFISVEEDIKFICVFEVLYYCGLRRGELRGLTWDNIDFNTKRLKVEKNVVCASSENGYWLVTTPKTRDSARTIPIPTVLLKHLKEYKEQCEKYYNFNNNWFVFGNITPIHPHTLLQRNKQNADKANVKQIRLHDFRHSCVSLLINNGANVTVVAKYLGHTKIDETLNTYTHLFQDKLDEVVNTINNLQHVQ